MVGDLVQGLPWNRHDFRVEVEKIAVQMLHHVHRNVLVEFYVGEEDAALVSAAGCLGANTTDQPDTLAWGYLSGWRWRSSALLRLRGGSADLTVFFVQLVAFLFQQRLLPQRRTDSQ